MENGGGGRGGKSRPRFFFLLCFFILGSTSFFFSRINRGGENVASLDDGDGIAAASSAFVALPSPAVLFFVVVCGIDVIFRDCDARPMEASSSANKEAKQQRRQ